MRVRYLTCIEEYIAISCFSPHPNRLFQFQRTRDQCLYPADIGVVVGAVAAGEVMDELINESEFGYLDG
jgi:hypothetical protein